MLITESWMQAIPYTHPYPPPTFMREVARQGHNDSGIVGKDKDNVTVWTLSNEYERRTTI